MNRKCPRRRARPLRDDARENVGQRGVSRHRRPRLGRRTLSQLTEEDKKRWFQAVEGLHVRAEQLRLASHPLHYADSPFRMLDESYLDSQRRATQLITDAVDDDASFALALCCSQLRDAVLETAEMRRPHFEAGTPRLFTPPYQLSHRSPCCSGRLVSATRRKKSLWAGPESKRE